MEECEFYFRCLNKEKCFRCFNNSLLKLPEDKQKARSAITKTTDKVTLNSKNSWEDLENTMVDELKKVPTMKDVRRSRGSGNQWFETGDVLDEILKLECKERTGNELVGGDKSLSIKKTWLTKAKKEAEDDRKIMALPFRFKGDDTPYIILEAIDIIELVNLAKAYRMDNEVKEGELKLLKEKLINL